MSTFKDQRLALGLTQEQVARKADVSLSYVMLVDRGYRGDWHKSPKLRKVFATIGLPDEPV